MNNHLLSSVPIDREQLDQAHFFEDLLQKAVTKELLSSEQLENIQIQWLSILEERVKRYTKEESCSVKNEVAVQIAQSIFYTISMYLKSLKSTEEMIRSLTKNPLSECALCGYDLIKKEIEIAEIGLQTVKKNGLNIDNIAYNDTMYVGLDNFFTSYDFEFSAQETVGCIDYPLCLDKMDTVGIEYISGYIHKIQLENQFCNMYPKKTVNELLENYDRNNADLLINVFELVLVNAFASVVLNRSAFRLDLSVEDCIRLQHTLSHLDNNQLEKLEKQSVDQICLEFGIENIDLKKYMVSALLKSIAKLSDSVKRKQLFAYFTVYKESDSDPIAFIDGVKMEDETFRKLTNEIRSCRFARDKCAIISRELQSFEDLMDVLEGECFFDDEYIELYKMVNTIDLALIMTRMPNFSYGINAAECNKEWQIQYVRFFINLKQEQQLEIREIAGNLFDDWL